MKTAESLKMQQIKFLLLPTTSLLILLIRFHVSCNPIAFDPTMAPLMSIPSNVPLPAPMIMSSHFDPYATIGASGQFLMSPFGPMAFDSHRRSFPGLFKPMDRQNGRPQDEETDEQKALKDLPISFIEPEGPATISERLSDSFSALGEGVRNHFRSMTENFSDTMEDIKDAWSWSDSRKRG